ncbi:hypothetical protein NHH03_12875 [Stieleria sp. TO1_6]|uniref:hypothetical protein n=1 Tax=Stieleria tagensis TaxID=2956795 RepID=UPI00209A6984|nr:hypothetical protein [Stieleria tagensis]MCO8122633.1 hypothetical protein [Stieleria tagensis]
MNATTTTSRDRTLIGLIALPLLLLGILLICSIVSWQRHAAQIKPMLLDSFGADIINTACPLETHYRSTTSTQQTATLRSILYAVDALDTKYRSVSSLIRTDDEDPAKESWYETRNEQPVDQYVTQYLDEARPIVDALATLDLTGPAIWLPSDFGYRNDWTNDVYRIEQLIGLLRINFHAALKSAANSAEPDTQPALSALRLYDQFVALPISTSRVGWEQRRLSQEFSFLRAVEISLQHDLWNETDLQTISDSVGKQINDQSRWQQTIESEQLARAPWLDDAKLEQEYDSTTYVETIAPSRRVEWLTQYNRLEQMGGIGTPRAINTALKIQTEYWDERGRGIDAALQFPLYSNEVSMSRMDGSKAWLAKLFAKVANERRHARTAVAIALYKSKFGSFPDTLDELSKVGLAVDDRQDLNHNTFEYVVDDDAARLGNAAHEFPLQIHTNIEIYDTPAHTLTSILEQYRMTTIR